MQQKFDRRSSAGYLTNWAARLFARAIDQKLKVLGVSSGQLPVFFALGDGGAMSQRAQQPGVAPLHRLGHHRDELGAHGPVLIAQRGGCALVVGRRHVSFIDHAGPGAREGMGIAVFYARFVTRANEAAAMLCEVA